MCIRDRIYSGTGTGDSVTTPSVKLVPMECIDEYCFSVTASSGGRTVIVEGTLDVLNFGIIPECYPCSQAKLILYNMYAGSTGNDNVNLSAAIAVPNIVIVGVLLAVVASIFGWNIYCARIRTPVIIKFSVKNKPGALDKALKIFEVRLDVKSNMY